MSNIFPWPHSHQTLYDQFQRIADAAGVEFEFGKAFHDLRRGFATANAANLDAFELQHLMQHKSLTTTAKYVAMAHRSSDAIEKLAVPNLKKLS